MKKGEVLELLIDDGSAIENLPGSVEKEGCEVLLKEPAGDGGWCITIKK